jgi:hypothetical protein
MALDIGDILDRLVSHAQTLGYFETVNEFKVDEIGGSGGFTLGIWGDDITPIRSSGLASTSVRVLFKVRIFATTEAAPESYLERGMVDATSALLEAYSGDFELGGEARNVDLLGAHGVPLSANAHYMNLSGTIFRVMDITVPVLVNDVWTQTA